MSIDNGKEYLAFGHGVGSVREVRGHEHLSIDKDVYQARIGLPILLPSPVEILGTVVFLLFGLSQ